ncbi:hypothetical protein Nepgr_008215 [Nepenthes gracilis]|uniref:J domain-containing protein n=1 Tax=Nepenthes gracilis TaxID=150966 RepID=A0AAD3XJ65_NEPGR|nr:hypothetical protein Nepgr_008215 [Nepenthes gracilis]
MEFSEGAIRTELCHRRRMISLSPRLNPCRSNRQIMFLYPTGVRRWLGSRTEPNPAEFAGENAYEILGVSETSSFDKIKASFRKLAKETHPDIASSANDCNTSNRFIRIVAAYEILSDPSKRALYDHYLLTQRKIVHKHCRQRSSYHIYASYEITTQMEVVEWLRWYRNAVKDILSERRVVSGTGYFDVLERDLCSAIHAAYYGPEIGCMDLLPDRFEAEERSVYDTPEVLHLVSGRDLFGIVRIVDNVPELSEFCYEKLTSYRSVDLDLCNVVDDVMAKKDFSEVETIQTPQMDTEDIKCNKSDAYKNLELHVFGKLAATATRVPPRSSYGGIQNKASDDQIHIFLSSQEAPKYIIEGLSKNTTLNGTLSKIPLGTITGLGTNPEESSCFFYNTHGTKSHVILKHRTLLVKHMHWFQLGDEVSICECRCTRARLPPSKYWLFEPRCSMHDIGGWYVETFGRDNKSQTVQSRRYWDRTDGDPQFEKRLHPARLYKLEFLVLEIEILSTTSSEDVLSASQEQQVAELE